MPQTTPTSNRACLEPCRELLEALPPESGFVPTTFAMFAGTPERLRGSGPNVQVRRSFRFELDGCCAHLTIEAPFRAAERRRIVADLLAAGYEPWLAFEDQADLRRWLRGGRERRAELELLHALGPFGAKVHWPQRIPRSRPRPVHGWWWPRPRWLEVMAEVEAGSMQWDESCLGMSRGGSVAARTASGTARCGVGVLTLGPHRFHAYASVSNDGDGRGTTLLPPRLATRLRGVLRAAGYRSTPWRSPKTGKVSTGTVSFSQDLQSARDAAERSARVFDALSRALCE